MLSLTPLAFILSNSMFSEPYLPPWAVTERVLCLKRPWQQCSHPGSIWSSRGSKHYDLQHWAENFSGSTLDIKTVSVEGRQVHNSMMILVSSSSRDITVSDLWKSKKINIYVKALFVSIYCNDCDTSRPSTSCMSQLQRGELRKYQCSSSRSLERYGCYL